MGRNMMLILRLADVLAKVRTGRDQRGMSIAGGSHHLKNSRSRRGQF
jgi:hypothetical protein